jgi:hypothetical protein
MKILIPLDFEIYDFSLTASTCLSLSGFPDELSCLLTSSSQGYLLTVLSGFASSPYTTSS